MARVFVLYVFISAGLRVIGKRELAELSPHELVMIMLIPELATQGLSREDFSITNSIIGISTLMVLVFLNSLFAFRFSKYKDITEGKPVILFSNGRLIEDALNRERIEAEEILSEIRAAGYEKLDQIKWVVLEPDGQLTCIPNELGRRSQNRPMQPI